MHARILLVALSATLAAGCGTHPALAPVAPRSAAMTETMSTKSLVNEAIAAFEKLPAGHASRSVMPLLLPNPQPPLRDGQLSIVKIQGLASTGLATAEAKPTFPERFEVTNAALMQIREVKLVEQGVDNVAATIGLYAALCYGYLGSKPSHESRYKSQAVTLQYLRVNQTESTLAKGGPIFGMGAGMMEAAVGTEDGYKIGVSVLGVIRDRYKDKAVSKQAWELVKQSTNSGTQDAAFQTLDTGLKDLAEKYR